MPSQSKPAPPPVSEKPSSFRDRIAAFNKPAAAPIAPFKPGGLGGAGGSGGFIKKPFVAPPPSRNAYVPPPRDIPTAKVYKRDEDPEIKEREAENLENAERAGLAPSGQPADGGDEEDQPKPTSLKERIALLQKQQIEQAQRHAEAAAKKEKPKRPPKTRAEGHEGAEEAEAAAQTPQPPPLERRDTEDTEGRASLEESHPPRLPHPPRRKSSKVAETQDGNEADMSGAGDTTEGQEDLTEREDSDEKLAWVPTAGKAPAAETRDGNEEEEAAGEEKQDEEEQEEGEEEEEDEDPEVRRKEELRARMAKMSGGMGMHGMFGPPAMMPMPGSGPAPPKKKKPPRSGQRRRARHRRGLDPYCNAGAAYPHHGATPAWHTRRSEDETGP